ncbi:FG-GAP-like repeat-containing protein [Acidobacteriota bacterium]
MRFSGSLALVALFSFAGFIAVPRSVCGFCTPVTQWVWEGQVRAPGHAFPLGSPLVVQLTDDNDDGFVDGCDTPDVIINHGGTNEDILTAVDGLTGADLFDFEIPVKLYLSGMAAGDIDNDGIVEIIAVHLDKERLVAFEHTGSVKWTSDPFLDPAAFLNDLPGIADLDQDGIPEIYVGATVIDADGSLVWQGAAGTGNPGWVNLAISNAADLAPHVPGLELLAGNTLYDAAGGIVWENTEVGDGYTAVGDLDGDGAPEIVLSSESGLFLLDGAGNLLYGPCPDAGAKPVRQPALADLDGDGAAEAIVVENQAVITLKWDGVTTEVFWRRETRDLSSGNGIVAYDLSGDGKADVIYHDEEQWYIFDGPTGDILFQIPYLTWTLIETPVIADIDNDDKTEILIGSWGYDCALTVYECDTAPPARSIWNQYQYHATNIRDDGTIPRYEPASWGVHNSWLSQTYGVSYEFPVPPDAGNTVRGVRSGELVSFSWAPVPGAAFYYLHRGTEKGVWPLAPAFSDLRATEILLPDLEPSPPLYFYRVAGVNCKGEEGP